MAVAVSRPTYRIKGLRNSGDSTFSGLESAKQRDDRSDFSVQWDLRPSEKGISGESNHVAASMHLRLYLPFIIQGTSSALVVPPRSSPVAVTFVIYPESVSARNVEGVATILVFLVQ
jgi:hypothetical protein